MKSEDFYKVMIVKFQSTEITESNVSTSHFINIYIKKNYPTSLGISYYQINALEETCTG